MQRLSVKLRQKCRRLIICQQHSNKCVLSGQRALDVGSRPARTAVSCIQVTVFSHTIAIVTAIGLPCKYACGPDVLCLSQCQTLQVGQTLVRFSGTIPRCIKVLRYQGTLMTRWVSILARVSWGVMHRVSSDSLTLRTCSGRTSYSRSKQQRNWEDGLR